MSLVNLILKRFIHLPVYKGPHTGILSTKKKFISDDEFENVYNRIRDVQNAKIEEPSPFHVVWRIEEYKNMSRKQRIILRKLGLNGRGTEPVIVPNTPHFNVLLWEIKSSISLRPVKFTDKIPEEKDIGHCKFNHFTGEFKVKPIYNVPQERLNYEPLDIYKGIYLRMYLKKLSGILSLTTNN